MSRKKIIHTHSNLPNILPNATQIEIGEIAINNSAGNEFLAIRNSNSMEGDTGTTNIVKFINEKEKIHDVLQNLRCFLLFNRRNT